MIRLSIIIPHHNQPDLLKILLASIGQDDFTQIIVIDDHSTQHLDELEALKRDPVYKAVLFLQAPEGQRGPGCARNLGIDHATGTHLMFCDSDDYLEKEWRSIVEPYLDGPQDLVYFTPVSRILGTMENAHRVDKYIKLIENHLKAPTQKTEDALRYTFYINPSKLIRRSMVETFKIRFDELMVSEDVMFATRTGHHAQTIEVSPKVIYCATRSPHSLTMTQTRATFDTRFVVLLRQHEYVRTVIGRKRYKNLDMPSLIFVVNAFTYHLGIGTAIKSLLTMWSHHIPVLRFNQFKPDRILSFLRLTKGAKKSAQ